MSSTAKIPRQPSPQDQLHNRLPPLQTQQLPAQPMPLPGALAIDPGMDPNLKPWGQNLSNVLSGLDRFDVLFGNKDPPMESRGERPLDWLLNGPDQPRAYLQPGSSLHTEHPSTCTSSEPAWSYTSEAHPYSTSVSSWGSSSFHYPNTAPPTVGHSWESKSEYQSRSPYETSEHSDADFHVHGYVNPQHVSPHAGSSDSEHDDDTGNPQILISPSATSAWDHSMPPPSTRPSGRRARSGSGVSAPAAPREQPPNKVQRSHSTGSHSTSKAGRKKSPASKVTKASQWRQSSVGRPFCCTFLFAGCQSRFSTKNEWKRHVSSMHMQLYVWRCDFAQCTDRRASVFNRKDLFGQHLKRCHAPRNVSPNQMRYFLTHDLKHIQERCKVPRRDPPMKTSCGFCEREFKGPDGWNQRMEHVGTHYESAVQNGGDDVEPEKWNADRGLIDWAIRESLVKLEGGRYVVTASSGKDAAIEGGFHDPS